MVLLFIMFYVDLVFIWLSKWCTCKFSCLPCLFLGIIVLNELSLYPGSQSEFIINTSKAGPGSLAVTVEGPSKVKLECLECPEGFRVHYTPMAPGNYVISIKYGGPNHIPGSPFKAKVTGMV